MHTDMAMCTCRVMLRRRRGTSLTKTTSEDVCNADVLMRWAKERGIKADKVSIADFVFEDPTGMLS